MTSGQPRILTFNFHEPYLCLMAKTGLHFDIGLYDTGGLQRQWHHEYRLVPENLTLREEPLWRGDLDDGKYDLVIAHNEMNAADIRHCTAKRLLVCHNRRSFLSAGATANGREPISEFAHLLSVLRERFEFVFISESKRDDYGIDGRVIEPGIDVADWGGYTGSEARVLRVGNTLAERNLMFDMPFQEEALGDLPGVVVGYNPAMPASKQAGSFEELRDYYRTCRCFFHAARQEYEDGYNLSMLEAMAAGMPVVALANRTGIITDGVDGYASFDAQVLHGRMAALLEDQPLAKELGARGRETVARRFPIDRFTAAWREAIFEAVAEEPKARKRPAPQKPKDGPRKILLHGIASPLTTARYFEDAARERHDVLTVGFRIPEAVFGQVWKFPTAPPRYRQQQIPIELHANYETMLKALPQGYVPDVYLWVDCGHEKIEPDIDMLGVPKVAYIIDSHVTPELRLEVAKHFDLCFLAQQGQVEYFAAHGAPNTHWLPLACSPALHETGDLERCYDVAYVGSLSPEESDRRRNLIGEVACRFPNNKIGKFWPREMARIYAESKIVVNACHNRDVNMRVFEAMAAGALLITDEADGLEELFEDGKHLVIYRDDTDVFELIERYLADDEGRERIAAAGRELVLAEHTYAKRMDVIAAKARELAGDAPATPKERWPKTPDYYAQPRRELIPHVPLRTRKMLEIGCGAGAFCAELRKQRNIEEAVGVEIVPEAYERAVHVLDKVYFGSVEEMELPYENGYFDTIICADVLEHLFDPWKTLDRLGELLAPDGVIIISIPNIRFHEIVQMLSHGAWTYMEMGIMDSTHLRFFTKSELYKFVESAGLEVAEIMPLNARDKADYPLDADGALTMGKLRVADVSEEEHSEFLAYQWIVVACHPGPDRLEPAREALARNQYDQAFSLGIDATGVDEFERNALLARAVTHLGKLDKAEMFYERALAEREDAELRGDLGILQLAMSNRATARQTLEAALAANPELGRARGALGMLLAEAEDYGSALPHLRAALDATHENHHLMPYLIASAEAADCVAEHLPLIGGFVEFFPGNLDLGAEYARLLAKAGNPAAALEVVENVLLFDPAHAAALKLRERLADEGA